jgi:hypothetical protein
MKNAESATENAAECCSDLRTKLNDWRECAERSAREEPVKTAGLALGAGVLLTVLPVGRILASLVQIALALVRPALLLLGVVKLVEQVEGRKKL